MRLSINVIKRMYICAMEIFFYCSNISRTDSFCYTRFSSVTCQKCTTNEESGLKVLRTNCKKNRNDPTFKSRGIKRLKHFVNSNDACQLQQKIEFEIFESS